ncbi:MAG: CYTH domain-containing protein [Nanoarchaeota archaeon]|nr:CYTH domain-containing protein [Nanoarchaeota archaeon]
MKEIEVKILEIDTKVILTKIKSMGATFVEKGLVSLKAYDFPDDRLVKKGQFIRVRKIAGRVELVFKDPQKGDRIKYCEETQVTVSDFDTTCALFEKIGMKKFAEMEKYRATYKVGEFRIEFDKYAGIPWFVEVEAPSEEALVDFVQKLGFDLDDKETVVAKLIKDVYGEHIHSVNFKEKGELPDYDSLFE